MLSAKEIMQVSPIIPVIAIKDASKAVDIALALQEGGINIMEITLRTQEALGAIEKVVKELPSMVVGAGTVINSDQFKAVKDVGAKFVISPGMTTSLLEYSQDIGIAFIPGVATASDIMRAMEYGLDTFKLFPANIVGSIDALKAFSGPFSNASFCPTGGIELNNMNNYLSLDNVLCVGGTWICPSKLIDANDFDGITQLCKGALASIVRNNNE